MQVVGPAKEILYLTQIKAHVPGFELPFARCRVDRLFIPVLVAENRENALNVYTSFPQTNGMPFETKITVLNRYLEFPAHQRDTGRSAPRHTPPACARPARAPAVVSGSKHDSLLHRWRDSLAPQP